MIDQRQGKNFSHNNNNNKEAPVESKVAQCIRNLYFVQNVKYSKCSLRTKHKKIDKSENDCPTSVGQEKTFHTTTAITKKLLLNSKFYYE